MNCLDDVHGYLAALNPSMLDVFPFVCFESVCLVSLFVSLVMSVMSLLCFTFYFCPECKRVSVVDFDELLFSSIPLAFVYRFDSFSVLNCLFLVCFHLLRFIGPLFRIWVNFKLFGLIFVFNYFLVFG